MKNAFAVGKVWHRRQQPREHAFRYRLYYSLLNCEHLETIFAGSRFWSLERFNLVSFCRSDYLGSSEQPLVEAVRDRIQTEFGTRPTGEVFVLTHLRQWGFCFNPVSFYFCHDNGSLAFIIAEVHNTPWNERHAYVLDCREHEGPEFRFRFAKHFHVSPFLPMDMDYDWRFRIEPDAVAVHMLVTEGNADCFSAGMKLELQPLTSRSMLLMPMKFPFLTVKVVAGIYWQALRLWLKRVSFHTHPDQEPDRS
jgi:uncharacterized protein